MRERASVGDHDTVLALPAAQLLMCSYINLLLVIKCNKVLGPARNLTFRFLTAPVGLLIY